VPILGVGLFAAAPLMGHWLPDDISESGRKIDHLWYFILYLTGLVFVVTEVVLFWFIWKYDGSKNPESPKFTHGSHSLELVWTLVPAATLLFIAFYQINAWAEVKIRNPDMPPTVEVMARQFEWRLRYPYTLDYDYEYEQETVTVTDGTGKPKLDAKTGQPQTVTRPKKDADGKPIVVRAAAGRPVLIGRDANRQPIFRRDADGKVVYVSGKKVRRNAAGEPLYQTDERTKGAKYIYGEDDVEVVNDLHVPVDEVVLVDLKSQDVLHSFFLPNLRVKQDAVPGSKIPVWFKAKRSGTYDLVCAELCGWGHYKMRGKLTVETREEFERWLAKMKVEQEATK